MDIQRMMARAGGRTIAVPGSSSDFEVYGGIVLLAGQTFLEEGADVLPVGATQALCLVDRVGRDAFPDLPPETLAKLVKLTLETNKPQGIAIGATGRIDGTPCQVMDTKRIGDGKLTEALLEIQ